MIIPVAECFRRYVDRGTRRAFPDRLHARPLAEAAVEGELPAEVMRFTKRRDHP